MSTYLGPLGNLIRFEKIAAEQIDVADRVKFKTTLAGVQKAQLSTTSPRSWQVGINSAAPEHVSHLTGLLAGLYGPPPWLYIGPWAQVSNMLTPGVSMLAPGSWTGSGTAGGPLLLADGSTPRYSISNSSAAAFSLAAMPAVEGVPVTASIWGSGDTEFSISLIFRDATGATIDTIINRVQATMSELPRRGSSSAIPPPGSASVIVRVTGAKRAALPSFTWTPAASPWVVGEGVPKVVARGLSKAVLAASREKALLRRISLSFTLEEVGNA